MRVGESEAARNGATFGPSHARAWRQSSERECFVISSKSNPAQLRDRNGGAGPNRVACGEEREVEIMGIAVVYRKYRGECERENPGVMTTSNRINSISFQFGFPF